jgi:hypothetical protein
MGGTIGGRGMQRACPLVGRWVLRTRPYVEAHLGSHRLVRRSDIYSMMAIQRIGEELRGTRGYPYHNTEESVRPRLCILN